MYQPEGPEVDCAKRERHIPVQVKELGAVIQSIQANMTELVNRLDPVLNKGSLTNHAPTPTTDDSIPELAKVLRTYNNALYGIEKLIGDVIKQLEI
jgi:methyl-accepting chemotaxis protein